MSRVHQLIRTSFLIKKVKYVVRKIGFFSCCCFRKRKEIDIEYTPMHFPFYRFVDRMQDSFCSNVNFSTESSPIDFCFSFFLVLGSSSSTKNKIRGETDICEYSFVMNFIRCVKLYFPHIYPFLL